MTSGWRELRSPVTGAALVHDGAHALRDADGRRWPVVDGIPYLRTGRDALTDQAIERLDAGDPAGALIALLADQDDWWTGPAPDLADLARLVAEADRLSLRDAMGLLGFGRVGDYFAHRWSDPTYLAGLALIEAHRAPDTRSAFELACGIGHYGREFTRRGVAYAGADVVFAKLWLARHWVLGEKARLVCFDAAAPWPVGEEHFDLVLCQDAFYFLEPKAEIRDRLRRLEAEGGRLLVGHVHNREAENYSAGRAVTAEELDALFPGAVAYDDAELTRALVEARTPEHRPLGELRRVEAFALASGGTPRGLEGGYAMPVEGAVLRVNPLYEDSAEQDDALLPSGENRAPIPVCRDGTRVPVRADEGSRDPEPLIRRCAPPSPRRGEGHSPALRISFPSERYASEYGPLATYPKTFVAPADAAARAAAIRCRALVDLPERW